MSDMHMEMWPGDGMIQPTSRFGQTIRTARQRLGLGLREVAEAAGISFPYLSELETKTFVPDAGIVVRIAAALELDPAKLLKMCRPDFKVWAKVFAKKEG